MEEFEIFEKMRLSTVFLIVFILHIQWVCGDLDTDPPRSTEKTAIIENNPAVEKKQSNDSESITIGPSVMLNKLLEQTEMKRKQERSQKQQSSVEVNVPDFIQNF